MDPDTSLGKSAGHLFVVRGDLTTISCDAVMLPTDSYLNVTRPWWRMIGDEYLGPPVGECRRYTGPLDSRLEEHSAARVGDSKNWLFITAQDRGTPESLAQSVGAAVRRVADGTGKSQNRTKPLLALPLAGTGDGGLAGERGAVVEHLLPVLTECAITLGLDIALLLADDRDAAAVQARRKDPHYWSEIPEALRVHADELGLLAAQQQLSLFLGAGVSRALGLPDWAALIDDLCEAALLPPGKKDSLYDAAQVAIDALGGSAKVEADILPRFVMSECTLAHALLAGLRIVQAVTTNYDTAYEVAVQGLQSGSDGPRLKVLTRTVVEPHQPWLLKLHGDARSGKGIVLTRSQRDDLQQSGAPLIGMVQSLLMTSHLLFVGYSLVDETFVHLANEVSRILSVADDRREPVATVLALSERATVHNRWGTTLRFVPMTTGDIDTDEGARLLSIFLDRLSWRSSQSAPDAMQYLLDDRYANVAREPADDALRDVAKELIARAGFARASAGWQHLAEALRRLGADSEKLLPDESGPRSTASLDTS